MGKEQDGNGGLNPGGSNKQKQPPKAMANFFMPISKRSKVATEVVVDAKKEQMPASEEPNASMVLAAIFDRKPGKKKKAKKGKEEPQEPEGSLSQPDTEFGGSQPAILIEQKRENESPAKDKKQSRPSAEQKRENESPAKDKKQSRPSPAKKKRKSGGLETKPMVGVHGSDLRLQARLAAEENARLSAGKAPHPFFARPKVGGARSLFGEEPSQIPEVRSVVQASNCSEDTMQTSPVKAPHPSIVRSKLGSARSSGVDEASNIFGNRSLVPSPPIHVTQNNVEEEVEPIWSPRWTWQNVAERRGEHGKVEVKLHLGCRPLSRQKWPSWGGANRWSQSISDNVALQQLVHYLLDSRSGSQYVLGEEVQFEVGYIKKLVERFILHYCSHPHGTHFENNLALHIIEGSEKDGSNTQNLLWTDRYQPQTSQEVCGNKEAVKSLNGWLQSWREKILSQKVALKKTEAEGGNDDDDNDDDDESDFDDPPSDIDDDSEDLYNCLVITGPVGCGKSAAIYACAMEQGFTVIEVNASECRNGALIKHKFKEAMESHGLSNRSSTAPVDNFDGEEDDEHRFKLAEVSGGSSFQEEISQSQPVLSQGGSRNNPPPPAFRRLRVILFEDVDTVFEEDAGFMGALGLLARTSKCPIIFSSNSQDPVLPQVRKLESIKFEQLSTVELVLHAFMVCMAEGVVCSPDIVEHIVQASGHDLRKLLMLLQFWSQGLPAGTKNLDCDSVLEMKQVNRNHIPDLINCLLQLDGCPQVFATTTHESDQKSVFARCSSRAHESPWERLNSTSERGNSRKSSLREGESARKIEEGALDPEWLFAYDSQHRVLPLLFSSSQPCQLTIQISEHLKGMGEKAMELADITVATWERHRFNELQAKADEATQARKTLRKLQLAARKEASAKSGMTNVVTDDVPEEILLERIANNSLSIGDRSILNEKFNVIQPLGHSSHVSRGIFSPTILSEGFDTLKGAPAEFMHRQDDRLDSCFTTTNISESEHRLLYLNSMLQNQPGMWSQVVNGAEEPVDFSFTKLMQSSYDSPAAQTAIKECNEDTWSLLQGDCEEDSPFPDLSMGHDSAIDEMYQSGMMMTTLPVNDNKWLKSVQEPTAFLTPGMDSAPHLHGTGLVHPQRHFGLEVCANRGVSHLERLGFPPLQQNVQLVAAENSSLLFPIFNPQDRPVELGAVVPSCTDTLANKDREQVNQNPTSDLTVSDNTKALDKMVEPPPSVDTLASNLMKQVWVKLRNLKLQDTLSDVTREDVLLENVLHDLSTCDILSTRNVATSQDSLISVQLGNLANQEHSYGGSRDSCTESAALLAQLWLNQALDQMTTSSSFSSEACQVHPPLSRQESKRQEKQACKDELVDTLLPQRCRILGGVARLDYASFHSQMTTAADRGAVNRTGPSTRQRKLI